MDVRDTKYEIVDYCSVWIGVQSSFINNKSTTEFLL
jgi:hypothetical protein